MSTAGESGAEVGSTLEALGTILFFLTGTLTISFFSSPVIVSFVVTSFCSSSTTGTTSWVEFWATGGEIEVVYGDTDGVAIEATAGILAFGTTLFFVTGVLMISFFSSPVTESFTVTSFCSSSTTGTTSWVEF